MFVKKVTIKYKFIIRVAIVLKDQYKIKMY